MKNYYKGMWSERFAIIWMGLKGYRVLVHRFLSPLGEVDLILKKGPTIVFMEVKNRPSFRAGLESITPRQQRRIGNGARDFLARNPYFSGNKCRFDLFLVVGFRCRHIKDAWRLS